MRCLACGWENPANSRFCNDCGAHLSSAEAPAAPAAARPPQPAPLDAELRRLLERVERLEGQVGSDGASAGHPPPGAGGGARGLAALSVARPPLHWPRTPRLTQPWAGPQAARWLAGAAGAAVGLLVLVLLLGPLVWNEVLPAVRRQVNPIPVPLAIAAAVSLLALLLARPALGALAHGSAGPRARSLAATPRALAVACWRPGGVVLALALAGLGQGLILGRQVPAGVLCYLGAAAIAWWHARTTPAATLFVPDPRTVRYEMPLLILILAVAALTRFVLLGQYPYGIEYDEMRWTYSVVARTLAGERIDIADLYAAYAPLSFWYEALFHQVLGPGVLAARVMVALLSMAASVAFYFLARRIAGVTVALLATFLMAVSIVDVSASRTAHIEPQVKLWAVLAPLFVVWALDTQRRWLLLLAGLSVVAGLLTYDTYVSVALAVGLYLGIVLLSRMIHDRRRWLYYVVAGGFAAVPVLLAVPQMLRTLEFRHGAYAMVWARHSLPFPPVPETIGPSLAFVGANVTALLQNLFVALRERDFFLNREGTPINAVLLPFLVLGLVWALTRVRERHMGLIVLWFGLAFAMGGVLTGWVVTRAQYPAYPAVELLIAIGIWWAYTALRAAVPDAWRRGLAASLVGGLALVGLFNTYIYFREVRDFDDQVHRRELSDAAGAAAGPGRMVYLAYEPNRWDFIDLERHGPRLAVRGRVGVGQVDDHSAVLTYDDLLPRVLGDRGRYQEATVIAEGPEIPGLGQPRLEILAALERCFPAATRRLTKHLAIYTLPAPALASPACSMDARVQLLEPAPGATVPAGRPVQLGWRIEAGAPRQLRLQVERRNDLVTVIEAEQFRGHLWQPENRSVDHFSGSGFLVDNYNAGTATFQVQVPEAGSYEVWARTYRRELDDTHAYLDLGNGPLEIARAEEARLNRWVWESLGRQTLPAGARELAISKDFGTSRQMALFVDAFVLSRDPTFDPERRGEWDSALDVELPATGGDTYQRDLPTAAPGHYRWRLQLLDGDRLIDARGRPGLWTAYQEFDVQ
jgi:4-amino-4-deoxy-L-arabinose transferase-like glycosyltransferase